MARLRLCAAVSCVIGVLVVSAAALALNVGDTVSSVEIKDANNKPAWIPDIGKKVITLFYTDPDVKDLNEPFRDMLKAANLDQTKYRGMGVANLKDTWKPNWIIRKIIRGKMEKFKSLILTDVDHTLKNKWNLGATDDKDIAIVIGKDRKVKMFKAWKMSDAEKAAGLKLVKELIAK
jgi:predicted transcriptional regulator